MQDELMLVQLMPDGICPTMAHDGDACYDLYTANEFRMRDIDKDQAFLIPLGIKVAIKPGYCGEVRSRSGITLNGIPAIKEAFGTKYRARIRVEHGTVDSNYRGEVNVLCRALNKHRNLIIPAHTKIAQLKIEQVPQGEVKVVDRLPVNLDRGDKGFGSSGV